MTIIQSSICFSRKRQWKLKSGSGHKSGKILKMHVPKNIGNNTNVKIKWIEYSIEFFYLSHTRLYREYITSSEMYSLHLTHPKWTHTRSSGQPCYSARGAVGGSVSCSRTPQSWYWRRREVIYSLTNNPCRTWDLNPQPLDYESDSLTIRPQLPPSDPGACCVSKCML